MAQSTWQTFRKTDANVITSFESIAASVGAGGSLQIRLAENYPQVLSASLPDVSAQPIIAKILNAGQALSLQISMHMPVAGYNINVNVRRDTKSAIDTLTIDYQDQVPPEIFLNVLSACANEFATYARVESVDRLLGNELAEFYRAREAGLLRLESVAQKLITDTDSYRQSLDQRFETKSGVLEEQFAKRKSELEAAIAAEQERLTSERRTLEELQKTLDDRASRHARRALRVDLQNQLSSRSKEFHLTAGTVRKRLATHALYLALLLLLIGFFTYEIQYTERDVSWYIRLGLTFAAIGATFILYIRWSDQWSRQHTDEEFRLKRMSLDVDRASWVVETAMEWEQQNKTPIPPQLLEQLSKDLFVAGPRSGPVRHPVEDLGAAVLAASTRLKVNLPGVGEATLDRKGVQQLRGELDEGRG